MKKIKKFLSLLLVVTMLISVLPTVAYAQESEPVSQADDISASGDAKQTLSPNEEGVYELSELAQLISFAEKVNSGETTLNAKLMADIDVTSISDFTIGTKDNSYGGVFDGNGHILAVNITSTEEAAAPFSYAGGVTIKNLTIAGTVATSAKYAGGFVGSTTGSLTFENCLSLVTINSSVNGDGTHGGFVGVVNSGDGVKVTVTNCGFAGAINGTTTNSCGGFAGWLNATMIVKNSFVSATYTASAENSNTIARNPVNLTVDNVYYLNSFGDTPKDAVAKTAEQFASGEVAFLLNNKSSDGVWKQNLGENADSSPNFSGATVYANFIDCSGAASEYGNKYFNERPEHTSYNENGFCTFCGEHQPATVDSLGCYKIANAGQFLWFVDQRNIYGKSVNAKLINNIDLSGIDYTPVNAPYNATFDGNGHTISNMTINTKKVYYNGNMVYGYLALFGGLGRNGVVKNFTLTGDITCTEEMSCVGGVAGYMNGAGAEISNVDSYVNITSATGKTLKNVGGIVGQMGSAGALRVENCRYYGTINLDNGKYVGGITGYLSGENNKLFKSVNSGDIKVNNGSYVGGVVGSMWSYAVVESCLNTGSVTVYGYERIGGVVGSTNQGNVIKNCGNTGSVKAVSTDSNNPAPYVGGVLGFVWRDDFDSMTGCYNTGTVSAGSNSKYCGALIGWARNCPGSDKIYNNYCLDGTVAFGTLKSGLSLTATYVTSSQVSSGELAYTLNGGVTDGTQIWYQDLNASMYSGSYPHISGKTVYKYTDCKGNVSYANKALSSGTHKYKTDGVCAVCGAKCSHTYNANEVCTVCGYAEMKLVKGYYEISNAEQLYQFASKVNSGENTINGKLTADIVINPGTFDGNGNYISKNGETVRVWTPIGNDVIKYKGKFDGNGKTVSGLYFNDSNVSSVGLFGHIYDADIRGVGVINSYIHGRFNVGGVVGSGFYSLTKIYNCYNTGTVSGEGRIGGIIGLISSGAGLDCCYNTGDVSAEHNGVGGIAGDLNSNSTRITNCYSTGKVRGKLNYVGAVIGDVDSNSFYTNCYYLADCATDGEGVVQNGVGGAANNSVTADVAGKTTSKSAEAFASGEVCYLLNNSKSTGVWKQMLGKDKLPKLTGEGDAVNYNADKGIYYSVHNWSKGVCIGCGTKHFNHNLENEICTVCGGYEFSAMNSEGYYEIENLSQLYWFAEKVNGGDNKIKAKLMADIDASSKSDFTIGTKDNYYCGVFDGNGHTITVNITSTEEAAAPFSYAGGVTIKNLTITGTVATSAKYAGGFIGSTKGAVAFENCLSVVTINSSVDGDGTHGGFVGVVNENNAVTFTNYGFAGAINGEKTTSCGGLVGWLNAPMTATNSFVAATYTVSSENGNAIARNDSYLTNDNVYYLNMLGGAPKGAVAKTEEQFASGEVAYLLNGKTSNGTWKQTLGTDKFPNFSGKAVYGGGFGCDGKPFSYNNESAGTVPEHSFNINGFCTVCGAYQPATLNSDGCYEIGNAGQFLWFGEKINNEERSINGKLIADIDLSGIKYIPITAPYRGTFDGCGYKISNMNVPSEEFNYQGTMKYGYAGLFGGLGNSAVVKNFTLTGSITCSADMTYVGGVAAYAAGGAEISNIKCYVDIKDGGVKNKAIDRVGGIVGQISSTPGSVVKNCSYYGNITLDRSSSTGGIVGYANGEGKILKCVNYGKINVNNGSHVGGVVGSLYKTTVENCMNYGSVEMHTHDCVGGVAGYANSGSYIKFSANVGTVSGTSTASNDQEPYVSGILGYVNDNNFVGIENCYNYGTLTASPGYKNCGAIIGWGRAGATADKFKNNYYLEGENVKAVGTTNDTSVTATSATASQFASGEIAYILNGEVTDGTQGWYQEITDTAKLDKYPVVSGKTVYKFADCAGDTAYANSALPDGSHKYGANGFCIHCDAYQPCELKAEYYEIGNAGQLYWFAEKVNSGETLINGRLTANIVVNPGTFSLINGEYTPKDNETLRPWIMIGDKSANPYSGKFDGNGKTVSGLYCKSGEYHYMGLFGALYAYADISNTGVVNSAFFYVPSTKEPYIGGLVGKAETRYGIVTITNCYSSAYVNCQSNEKASVGGLLGHAYALYGYNIIISNCYSSGKVDGNMTGRSSVSAGGLVGKCLASSDTQIEISACYNTSDVNAVNTGDGYEFNVGGVVGYCSGDVTVKNSYNTGNLTANGEYVYVGGVVSRATEKTNIIQNCYSIGGITATGDKRLFFGGVIGETKGGTIENCYYLNSIAGQGIGANAGAGVNIDTGAKAKTTDEFASGEVAYLLQSGVGAVTETDESGNETTYTPLVWGQTSSTAGSTPILTSTEGYRVLPVTEGGSTVNYSVLKKGETNGDGQVDVCDYQNAVNIALSSDNIKEIADKYDYNGDGVIDALDCLEAEKDGVTDEFYAELSDKVIDFEGMCYMKNVDINDDGIVDVLDLSTFERLLSGHRVKIK